MLFCGLEILHSPSLNLKPSLNLDFSQIGKKPEFLPVQSDHKKKFLDFFVSRKKPEILHSPYLNHSTTSVTQSQGSRTSLGLRIY